MSASAPGPTARRFEPSRSARTGNDLKIEVAPDTHSPNLRPFSAELEPLERLCGEPDQRLDDVARALLTFRPLGKDSSDIDRLTFALRAAGTPYLRPVTWPQRLPASTRAAGEALEAGFRSWLSTLEPVAVRRCGMARSSDVNDPRLIVIAAQALAELRQPLPTRVRVGQWLDFRAELLAPAEQSQVLLLGPEGEPQVLPTTQQGSIVSARFAARSPGKWLIQLLASGDTGPRPMLEAVLYADVPAEREFATAPAPGEDRALGAGSEEQRIDRLVSATRALTGRPALRRDPLLDRLATEHAVSMRRNRRVGHDVGEGSTHERLERGGLQSHLAGENVVHAQDAVRAHRALWASPSHRTNLLHRGFSRWGLGVVTDVDGSLWICELFAGAE